MPYKIIIPLFLLFLFAQCKDREMVSLTYQETQCADPWACSCQTDAELKQAIEDFLQENTSGNFSDVEIVTPTESLIYCHACTCPTGTTIRLEVRESDLEEYLSLGFSAS